MTHCYNCGHTGTFVLLVQFALAVPGHGSDCPDPTGDRRRSRPGDDARRNRPGDRSLHDGPDARDGSQSRDRRRTPAWNGPPIAWGLPTEGDLSLAVQCPACDSTDVNVAAVDLLARYGSNTTS